MIWSRRKTCTNGLEHSTSEPFSSTLSKRCKKKYTSWNFECKLGMTLWMYINSRLNIVKRCSLQNSSSYRLLEPPDNWRIQFECVSRLKTVYRAIWREEAESCFLEWSVVECCNWRAQILEEARLGEQKLTIACHFDSCNTELTIISGMQVISATSLRHEFV